MIFLGSGTRVARLRRSCPLRYGLTLHGSFPFMFFARIRLILSELPPRFITLRRALGFVPHGSNPVRCIKKVLSKMDNTFLAAELGFEPRLNGSEPFVLPLHNSASHKKPHGAVCFVFNTRRTAGGYPAWSFAVSLSVSGPTRRTMTGIPEVIMWV